MIRLAIDSPLCVWSGWDWCAMSLRRRAYHAKRIPTLCGRHAVANALPGRCTPTCPACLRKLYRREIQSRECA